MLKNVKTLNNGADIPVVGLGTWQIPDSVAETAVRDALKVGYVHIDTAAAYENERGVGKGIKASGLPRKDIFVTSKIPAEYKSYEIAVNTIEKSLELLDTDYIDLMLIHSPRPWEFLGDPDAYNYNKENIEVYTALEEAYGAKKVRAIGVSNFSVADIENIIDNCNIVPAVNQVCCYIGNTPFGVMDYCNKKGIAIEAYSPIATGRLLKDESLGKIAARYGVSVPRLCIKYVLQLGAIALPKTTHRDYMIDNARLDFEISADDMELLKNVK